MGQSRRRGSTLVEFTLVGIPLIFLLISTEEIARGMWIYHTEVHAVNEAAQYAAVHGEGCVSPNTCGITVGDITTKLAQAGGGLDAGQMSVTLTSTGGDVACNPMSSCLTSTTAWPPTGHNQEGTDITISAVYSFQSALSMFWPGRGSVRFGVAYFPAFATQQILF
jgi:hypothetical protein